MVDGGPPSPAAAAYRPQSDFVGLEGHVGYYLAAGPAHTSRHEAHSIKVLVPLGSVVRVDGEASRVPLLVPPNVAHTASCEGPALTILLDPERTSLGMLERTAAGAVAVEGREGRVLMDFASEIARPRCLRGAWREVEAILGAGGPPARGALVDAALGVLQERPEISLADLSTEVGVSTFHLSREFRRRVGVSFRRWRLWMRLVRATVLAMSGTSLVDAALRAGFSDQAHFNRTCRRLMGRTPKNLLVRNSVQYWGSAGE